MLPLPELSPAVLAGILYTGVGCSFLSFWLWTLAVDRIGPVRAGMVYYSLPLFAAAGSFLVLGERVTEAQLMGGCLVIGGILVATWPRHAAASTPNEGKTENEQGTKSDA